MDQCAQYKLTRVGIMCRFEQTKSYLMPAHDNGAHQLINTSDVSLVYLEVKMSTVPAITKPIQYYSDNYILIYLGMKLKTHFIKVFTYNGISGLLLINK